MCEYERDTSNDPIQIWVPTGGGGSVRSRSGARSGSVKRTSPVTASETGGCRLLTGEGQGCCQHFGPLFPQIDVFRVFKEKYICDDE